MESEFFLLTGWVDSKPNLEKILHSIEELFTIVDCCEIKWSESCFENNIRRFYGKKARTVLSIKDLIIKRNFITIVFRDDYTDSDKLDTLSKIKKIETVTNDFSYDSFDESFIRVTTNKRETNRELTLLFGVNYDDYVSHNCGNWKGSVSVLKRDLSGECYWESIKDFFYVLNNTIQYVLLRGEEFINGVDIEEHGDVDLLVEDLDEAIRIINGFKVVYSSPVRPKIFVNTESDGSFLFDLWLSKLQYHSPEWHKNMLATKVYTGLFYKLSLENEFYSLIYHCLIHKKNVASDYLLKLDKEFHSLNLDNIYDRSAYKYEMDLYYQVLMDYMRLKQYQIAPVVEDTHCFYNKRIERISNAITDLQERTDITDIKPFRVNLTDISEYFYFTGEKENDKVLIKYGGIEGICANELYFSNLVSSKNSINFLTPFSADLSDVNPFIIFKYCSGESIDKYCISNPDKIDTISEQLYQIIRSLMECDVIHRNINRENLVVCNNTVLLLGFQYATTSKGDSKFLCLNGDIGKTLFLGGENRYKKYSWWDYHSIIKVVGVYVQNYLTLDSSEKRFTVRMPLNKIIRLEVKNCVYNIKVFIHSVLFVRNSKYSRK